MKTSILFFLLVDLTGYCQYPLFVDDKKFSTWGTKYTTVDLNHVAFSLDDKYLAAGSLFNMLIWDIASGEIFKSLNDGKFATYDVAYSPDGKFLAAVGSLYPQKGIKVWSTADYSLIKTINYEDLRKNVFKDDDQDIPRVITCVYFSPDSKLMITADDEGTISLWETGTWELLSTKKTREIIWSVQGTGNGILLTGNDNGEISIWEMKKSKLKLIEKKAITDASIMSISVSADNRYFSANTSDTLKILSLPDCRLFKTVSVMNYDDVYDEIGGILFTPAGDYFISGHSNNNLKIWSAINFELLDEVKGENKNESRNEAGFISAWPEISYTGNYLAMSNNAGFIYLYRKNK